MAKVLELALGPVPQMLSFLANYQFEIKSIPDFAGGFMFALLGESDLPEIDACYNGVTPLVSIMEDFITNLLDFNILAAIEALESFIFHFQLDFQPCTMMSDDMAAVSAYFAQLKDPLSLIPIITKNYLLHQRKISADWADEQLSWSTGDYFQAGEDVGDILVLALGKIEESEAFNAIQ